MKKPLIRVTQILADNNMYPAWSQFPQVELEAKAALGTIVHRLCAGAGKGKWFDNDSPADAYVRQYVKWLKDSGAEVLRTEFTIRATIAGLKYIGHADLELEWNREKWLVDIKTGAIYPAHPIQIAGYAAGVLKHHRRGILQLTPRSARLIPMVDTGLADKRWEACCLLSKMRGLDHAKELDKGKDHLQGISG